MKTALIALGLIAVLAGTVACSPTIVSYPREKAIERPVVHSYGTGLPDSIRH